MLRHHKLTSMIREKILRPSSHPHLHFELYRLYWQPDEASEPVRVHGELYSLEAFLDAHSKLQDSPGEPGCELPRVVVGLMFSSDSTHLTAFSSAKLWPVYLAFGNESKNRRSKPSCHAFEHIAYLQTVSAAALFVAGSKLFNIFNSIAPRHLQSIRSRTHWREGAKQCVNGALPSRSLQCPMDDHPRR